MATVKQVAEIVTTLFPPENVCMKDYIGLMAGSHSSPVEKVVVCLDCTEKVVKEAAEKGAQMIITHHPLIFGAISAITDESVTGKVIMEAIKHGISVYSAHTNMDCSAEGITRYLADVLKMKNVKPLVQVNESAALGLVGEVDKTTLKEYATFISNALSDKYVKIYGTDKEVGTVAIVNGAGGDEELVEAAVAAGADCYVTGEIKHHVALLASALGLSIIETSHYTTEHAFMPQLVKLLCREAEKNNLEIQFTVAESESNPAL